jgi:NTP pyrophosphatase (non-canonical NTP hydrolase)
VNGHQQRAMIDVLEERRRQDAKFGNQDKNTFPVWMTILTEEVGEAAKEILERRLPELREELVQVAAVALKMIERLDEAGVSGRDLLR